MAISLLLAAPGAALALAAAATPATLVKPAALPPVCAEPSHDRLLVQPGRDVCAPALSPKGEPRAAGLLPTRCAGTLRIDAVGERDLCLPTVTSARGVFR